MPARSVRQEGRAVQSWHRRCDSSGSEGPSPLETSMRSSAAVALPMNEQFLRADAPAAMLSPVPALAYLDAMTLEEALPQARTIYANAERCSVCRSLLAHRFERLGSTLFRDEDPRMLARAFSAADRDGCTLRLLAACIVLFGRERVAVSQVESIV